MVLHDQNVMKATDGVPRRPQRFWKVFLGWPGTLLASELIYWLNCIYTDQGSKGPGLVTLAHASLPSKIGSILTYISLVHLQSQRCAPMEAPPIYVTLGYLIKYLTWEKSEVLVRVKSIKPMRAQCCGEWIKASPPERRAEHLFLSPLQVGYRMLLAGNTLISQLSICIHIYVYWLHTSKVLKYNDLRILGCVRVTVCLCVCVIYFLFLSFYFFFKCLLYPLC